MTLPATTLQIRSLVSRDGQLTLSLAEEPIAQPPPTKWWSGSRPRR